MVKPARMPMSSRLLMAARMLSMASALLVAAACDGGRNGAGNRSPAAAQLEADGRIEWRAVLACADCDGIDTRSC